MLTHIVDLVQVRIEDLLIAEFRLEYARELFSLEVKEEVPGVFGDVRGWDSLMKAVYSLKVKV